MFIGCSRIIRTTALEGGRKYIKNRIFVPCERNSGHISAMLYSLDLTRTMKLQEEIDTARAAIRTDRYSMSIGEWISLYENEEIDIHPEFQRFFRWTNAQKTRLIESILLGIPIPPIFVAQRENGIWDVVDGLQRLSTIYQFVGILKNEEGELIEPLFLEPTTYLPSLAGMKWNDENDLPNSFTSAQRLLIKRAKIAVSIILRESDDMSKYELFQRLNTGGSPLSAQEVRNAILVMINQDFYRWLRKLSQDASFRECVSLTDRALEEQYDMDLALRFVVFRKMATEKLKEVGDINDFLTQKAIELAENPPDLRAEEEAFAKTFALLNASVGSNSMKKYDKGKGKFVGGFLVSAFEVVALGIGYNIDQLDASSIDIEHLVKEIWSDPAFTSAAGSGVRASSRIPKVIPHGRTVFGA